jgi:hypothetical protein
MCMQGLLAVARLANIFSPLVSTIDDSSTPLLRDADPPHQPTYTAGFRPMSPPFDSLNRGFETQLQAKFDTLLDAKFRDFETRSLNPLLSALRQLDERWTRIELILDKCKDTDEADVEMSNAQTASTESHSESPSPSSSQIDVSSPPSVGQMPGSFPAFDASSPTSSCFSATPSELEQAIEVCTTRYPLQDDDGMKNTTTQFEDVYKMEKDVAAAKALPKEFMIPVKTVPRGIDTPANAVLKEVQLPVNTNPWTTVSKSHVKSVDVQLKSSNAIPTHASRYLVLENVVESRGRRLQVLKNELRVKEENNKLVKVDPDGMAVRSLDPRPCHRYYLGRPRFVLCRTDKLTHSLEISQSGMRQSTLLTWSQLPYV